MAASIFAPDGTPLYTYAPGVALAAGENTLARGATAVVRATPAGALLGMYDLQLRSIASVRTSDDLGVFPGFFATAPAAVLDAGSVQLPIYSTEAVAAGLLAEARAAVLADKVQQLVDSLPGYVTDDQLQNAVQEALAAAGGGGGGGSTFTGTISPDKIDGSTELGRRLIQIIDAVTAREAIGAGTSNLAVGTTATTAKAGNWKPALADMPAGHRTTVDYVRSDGYSAANAWPAVRPSARTDVYFDLIGPASTFVVGQVPLSWIRDGDTVLREST